MNIAFAKRPNVQGEVPATGSPASDHPAAEGRIGQTPEIAAKMVKAREQVSRRVTSSASRSSGRTDLERACRAQAKINAYEFMVWAKNRKTVISEPLDAK